MAVLSIVRDWGTNPAIVRMTSDDSLATIATAGYLTDEAENIEALNSGTWTWLASDFVAVTGSNGNQIFTLSTDLTSLEVYSTAGNGGVTLPVVAGNFAIFDGVLGALEDGGFLPSDATKTNVVMQDAASVIGNVPLYADVNGTIIDSAAAPSDPAQTIFVMQDGASVIGNLPAYSDILGTVTDSGAAFSDPAQTVVVMQNGASVIGNIPAYLDVTGTLTNAAGFVPSDATQTNIVMQDGASVIGGLPEYADITGTIVDSGTLVADLQLSANIMGATTADIGGGGAGPIVVPAVGLAATSIVVATVESSTNPVSVVACTAGVDQFSITFSADPGAACLVNWIALVAAQ